MWIALVTLLIGMSSVQFGASQARALFPVVGATGATTWRLGIAALIMLLVFRPWRGPLSRQDLKGIVYYGLALGVMNITFYLALARIPLGVAVALEFTGPLTLALLTSRKPRDFMFAILAAFGLALLFPGVSDSQLDPWGVAMALTAGAAWALYIVFGQKAAPSISGSRTAALGMIVAALLALPVGLLDSSAELWHPEIIGLAFVVALFSSAIPYSLEMIALKRLPANTFSILMSLEPAIATLMGWLFLQEYLSQKELLAVGCIMGASLGSALSAKKVMVQPES